MNIADRPWSLSPREITRVVRRRARMIRGPDRPKPSWHRVAAGPIAGAELYLATEQDESWRAMVAGTHDQFLFDACVAAGPLDGKVCWDVGSHVGFHAMTFASLVGPGGKVVTFEPNPANLARIAEHLGRNAGLASRITVKPVALSDRAGVADFMFSDDVEHTYSSGGFLTSATTPSEAAVYQGFALTQVPTDTIDRLVESGELPAPDLMKVDVEGAEGAVLRGGRQVIASRRPTLLLEVHHILQMFEISQFLQGQGYRIEVLDRESASPGRCFILARADAR